MPELPEVEVTRQSLAPHIVNQSIIGVQTFSTKLRYPIDPNLNQKMSGAVIKRLERRSKYIFIVTTQGTLMVHLGMTGTLTLAAPNTPLMKHDHVQWNLGEFYLRYHDPRRFGAVLWAPKEESEEAFKPYLGNLGLEPFDSGFDGDYFWQKTRTLKQAIKPLLLSGKIVVGVGNIYASEALFSASIHPFRSAQHISRQRYQLLARTIQETLQHAIELGGSTLKDFQYGENQNGYFQIHHQVYDRESQPCLRCQQPIKRLRQGQRSTFYCSHCQH